MRALIVGRTDRREELEAAAAALVTKRMGKLHDVFEIEIVDRLFVPAVPVKSEASAYRDAVREWLGPYRGELDIDLAFVLHEDEDLYRRKAKGLSPYYASKAVLLMAGIPTQSICYKNLLPGRQREDFQRYYVSNILVACYAKIGGTPWVIQDDSIGRPEVTLGIATTAIRDHDRGELEHFVGISTIFKENGAFVLWQLTPLFDDLEAYQHGLESSIVKAISTYESMEGRAVTRIACHVSGKRAGRREIDAVRRALKRAQKPENAADLVHISDDATLWLFDGKDASHRPKPGFLARLSSDGRMALLHTEGRADTAFRKFPPRPLKLGVHSELPAGGAHEIFQHLYDLRWMSWRGVGRATRPVSIDYPSRMSRLLAHLHLQEEVEAINFLPKLTKSAWFL